MSHNFWPGQGGGGRRRSCQIFLSSNFITTQKMISVSRVIPSAQVQVTWGPTPWDWAWLTR